MLKNTEILQGFNLFLFDGGAAGGSSAAPAAGVDGGIAEGNPNPSAPGRQTKKGETVLYGRQPAQGKEAGPAAPDQEADDFTGADGGSNDAPTQEEFEALIKGQYKDHFTAEVNRIVNDRFKQMKGLEKQLGEVTPVLDSLMARYSITDGDVGKLSAAIEADDAYWEETAEKEGLTVEQYKHMKKMESENSRLKAVQEQNRRNGQARALYQGWVAEAEGLKADIPDFDLEAECRNPKFVQLLSQGIDMATVHKIVHFDDMQAAAAQKAEKKVADTIKAGKARPPENGAAAAQSGVIIKSDVSQLTREDRREIARRVARGESINF